MKKILKFGSILFLAMLVHMAGAQNRLHSPHKSGDAVQLVYSNLTLKPGKVLVVLIGQHGQKESIEGTLQTVLGGLELDFTLPKVMANDEWQAWTATQDGTTVPLRTMFHVTDK